MLDTSLIVADGDLVLTLRIVGAAVGSSVAVLVKLEAKNLLIQFKGFIVGTVTGVIATPFIIDYFDLIHSFDYWLGIAFVNGMFGFIIVRFLLSDEVLKTIKTKITRT